MLNLLRQKLGDCDAVQTSCGAHTPGDDLQKTAGADLPNRQVHILILQATMPPNVNGMKKAAAAAPFADTHAPAIRRQ